MPTKEPTPPPDRAPRLGYCPKCHKPGQMFTSDLNHCATCNIQWNAGENIPTSPPPPLQNRHGGGDLLLKMLASNVASMATDMVEMTHLIAAAKIVPGVTTQCRCDGCRKLAIAFADSEYMKDVKDRWWES